MLRIITLLPALAFTIAFTLGKTPSGGQNLDVWLCFFAFTPIFVSLAGSRIREAHDFVFGDAIPKPSQH